MKMDIVAGSQNDEFYTPACAIAPLLKYIPSNASVWCPFDTKESWFVRLFSERGNKVLGTHLSEGYDFFQVNFGNLRCDYIISNPPYSKKTEVLQALFASKIKFAMLVGVVGLFESQRRFSMFQHHDFEIMYFNKRISYLKNYNDERPAINPPFSSVYVCFGILPKQIVFETIEQSPPQSTSSGSLRHE